MNALISAQAVPHVSADVKIDVFTANVQSLVENSAIHAKNHVLGNALTSNALDAVVSLVIGHHVTDLVGKNYHAGINVLAFVANHVQVSVKSVTKTM